MIMTLAAFLTAVLGLLLTPGPTNTLMGLAGASAGLTRVARLLPAEILCYLTMILPLAFMGAGSIARRGQGGTGRMQVIQRAASAWLALVSVMLVAGVVRA
jgi:hypothetical protein